MILNSIEHEFFLVNIGLNFFSRYIDPPKLYSLLSVVVINIRRRSPMILEFNVVPLKGWLWTPSFLDPGPQGQPTPIGPYFQTQDGLKLEDLFLKLRGVHSWVKIIEIWQENDATLMPLRFFKSWTQTQVLVNSLDPKLCSQPIRSLNFKVSLVLDPSVNLPLTNVQHVSKFHMGILQHDWL